MYKFIFNTFLKLKLYYGQYISYETNCDKKF